MQHAQAFNQLSEYNKWLIKYLYTAFDVEYNIFSLDDVLLNVLS